MRVSQYLSVFLTMVISSSICADNGTWTRIMLLSEVPKHEEYGKEYAITYVEMHQLSKVPNGTVIEFIGNWQARKWCKLETVVQITSGKFVCEKVEPRKHLIVRP